MKTQKQIEEELHLLIDKVEAEKAEMTDREENKLRKRITLLRFCQLIFDYPSLSESKLVEMKIECENKIAIYNKRLRSWIEHTSKSDLDKLKSPKEYYYREVAPKEKKELANANSHIKTLEYILS